MNGGKKTIPVILLQTHNNDLCQHLNTGQNFFFLKKREKYDLTPNVFWQGILYSSGEFKIVSSGQSYPLSSQFMTLSFISHLPQNREGKGKRIHFHNIQKHKIFSLENVYQLIIFLNIITDHLFPNYYMLNLKLLNKKWFLCNKITSKSL